MQTAWSCLSAQAPQVTQVAEHALPGRDTVRQEKEVCCKSWGRLRKKETCVQLAAVEV